MKENGKPEIYFRGFENDGEFTIHIHIFCSCIYYISPILCHMLELVWLTRKKIFNSIDVRCMSTYKLIKSINITGFPYHKIIEW